MKVIDHEPQFWFLLGDGEALFLDVACGHGAVGYSVLIQLNREEEGRYAEEGSSYLSTLANAINYSAPGVIGSRSIYKDRNVSSKYDFSVMAAVREWQTEQERGI